MNVWRAKPNPWDPIDYNEDVTYAVRAIASGTANKGQQQLFWDWFQHATGKDDISFRPGEGGERATAFAEGKRFLGQQVAKHLHPLMTPKAMNAPQPEKSKPQKKKRK
jgi:hypothetical protein